MLLKTSWEDCYLIDCKRLSPGLMCLLWQIGYCIRLKNKPNISKHILFGIVWKWRVLFSKPYQREQYQILRYTSNEENIHRLKAIHIYDFTPKPKHDLSNTGPLGLGQAPTWQPQTQTEIYFW